MANRTSKPNSSAQTPRRKILQKSKAQRGKTPFKNETRPLNNGLTLSKRASKRTFYKRKSKQFSQLSNKVIKGAGSKNIERETINIIRGKGRQRGIVKTEA